MKGGSLKGLLCAEGRLWAEGLGEKTFYIYRLPKGHFWTGDLLKFM